MALTNSVRKTFLYIINGKITKKVTKEDPGAIARENKNNQIVYELLYDNLTGVIADISTNISDYGKEWLVEIKDADETYQLSLPYSSRAAKALLCCLPNIHLTAEVKLSPYQKEIDGKKQSGMFISQGGNAIKWHYTKEHRNGLPEMEKIFVKGEEKWDDSKQLQFLETELEKIMSRNKAEYPDEPKQEDGLPF